MSGSTGCTWTVDRYIHRSPGAGRPKKLTLRQSNNLRRRNASGEGIPSLAKAYGLCPATVRRYLGVERQGRRPVIPPAFTSEQAEELRARFAGGAHPRTLAEERGVSLSTMRRVLRLTKDGSY